jgi:MFS superfamily sulfate permease-like transporter
VILQLQGYSFFGTANSLYEKIKQLTAQPEKAIKFVVLDMMLVQGIDSSAVKSFEKLARDLEKKDIYLIVVNPNEVSTDVYFIVRGQVTLIGTNPEGSTFRFRTLGPWTLTGEIGAFLGYQAPYDATVEKAGLIYRLSAENRKKLEDEDLALASDLQRLIITMLGSQLMKTTRAVGGIGS